MPNLSCKTIEWADYDELHVAIQAVHDTFDWLRQSKEPLNLPHRHRTWEYASALQATLIHFRPKPEAPLRILDVGCGLGLMAPVFAQAIKCEVLEIDPSPLVAKRRVAEKLPSITTHQESLDSVEGFFDVVTAISTMEHLPPAQQEAGWAQLATRVAPGGLLVATVDFSTDPSRPWANAQGRDVQFGPEDLDGVRAVLWDNGIETPTFDYTDHGNLVYDYTFFRIIGQWREREP